jgi:hypothetical protein
MQFQMVPRYFVLSAVDDDANQCAARYELSEKHRHCGGTRSLARND